MLSILRAPIRHAARSRKDTGHSPRGRSQPFTNHIADLHFLNPVVKEKVLNPSYFLSHLNNKGFSAAPSLRLLLSRASAAQIIGVVHWNVHALFFATNGGAGSWPRHPNERPPGQANRCLPREHHVASASARGLGPKMRKPPDHQSGGFRGTWRHFSCVASLISCRERSLDGGLTSTVKLTKLMCSACACTEVIRAASTRMSAGSVPVPRLPSPDAFRHEGSADRTSAATPRELLPLLSAASGAGWQIFSGDCATSSTAGGPAQTRTWCGRRTPPPARGARGD
jgi:hypothetical protein